MANEFDPLNPTANGTAAAPVDLTRQTITFKNNEDVVGLLRAMIAAGAPGDAAKPSTSDMVKQATDFRHYNTLDGIGAVAGGLLMKNPIGLVLGGVGAHLFGHQHHDGAKHPFVLYTTGANGQTAWSIENQKDGIHFVEGGLNKKGEFETKKSGAKLDGNAFVALVETGVDNSGFAQPITPMTLDVQTPPGPERLAVYNFLHPQAQTVPAGFDLLNTVGTATGTPDHTRGAAHTRAQITPIAESAPPNATASATTLNTTLAPAAAALLALPRTSDLDADQLADGAKITNALKLASNPLSPPYLLTFDAKNNPMFWAFKDGNFNLNGSDTKLNLSNMAALIGTGTVPGDTTVSAQAHKVAFADPDQKHLDKFVTTLNGVAGTHMKVVDAQTATTAPTNTPTINPATGTADLDIIAGRIYTTAADYWDNVSGAQAKNTTGARAKAAWEALPEDGLKKDIAKLLGDYVATHPQGKRTDADNPFTNGDLKKLLQSKLTGQDLAKLTSELDAADAKGKTAEASFAAPTVPTKTAPQLNGAHHTGTGTKSAIHPLTGGQASLAGRAAAATPSDIANSADLAKVQKDFTAFAGKVPQTMAERMRIWIAASGGQPLKNAAAMTGSGTLYSDFAGINYTPAEQKLWNGMKDEINALQTRHPDQYNQLPNWLAKFKVPADATKPGLNGNSGQGASMDPAAGDADTQLSNTPPKGITHTAVTKAGAAASALEHFVYNYARRMNTHTSGLSTPPFTPDEMEANNAFMRSIHNADPGIYNLVRTKVNDYRNAHAENWDVATQDRLRMETIHGFAQTIMADGTQSKFDKLPPVVDAPPVPAAPTAPTMPPAGTVPHLPRGGAQHMQI